MEIRVGQGFDIHALAVGRPLILGGVAIPWEKGLRGHSDADCLMHAIIDAMLGAAGLGDIGEMFPDTDERWRGADSRGLLRVCVARLAKEGWQVVNVDATVIAQAPKLTPYKEAMRANIASEIGIAMERVNVKAKTAERLGALGRGEGIAAEAIVLLRRG